MGNNHRNLQTAPNEENIETAYLRMWRIFCHCLLKTTDPMIRWLQKLKMYVQVGKINKCSICLIFILLLHISIASQRQDILV